MNEQERRQAFAEYIESLRRVSSTVLTRRACDVLGHEYTYVRNPINPDTVAEFCRHCGAPR
jgi:hypothetical protein